MKKLFSSWEQQPYPWAAWGSLENDHIKRRPGPSPYHGVKKFLTASRIRVELIRRTERPVFICMVQGRLVAARYYSRHPDGCPGRIPDHRCCRRMLTDRLQNWNPQHWYHTILEGESRLSLYHSGRRVHEFQLFLGCNNHLALPFNNTTKNSGMPITLVVEAGYGLICKQYMRPVLMVPVQGPVSISVKTSYRKISWSLEAARLIVQITASLLNLTGTSAAVLPRCLSNFKAIGQL